MLEIIYNHPWEMFLVFYTTGNKDSLQWWNCILGHALESSVLLFCAWNESVWDRRKASSEWWRIKKYHETLQFPVSQGVLMSHSPAHDDNV